MKAIFRVDSSARIGSGHLMRCLTLADQLSKGGAKVGFICRNHKGNLNRLIVEKGYAVTELERPSSGGKGLKWNPHAFWLGVDRQDDAEECIAELEGENVDWLIVDHYALDREWERELRPQVGRIMVIDDLADRPHECDMLLDQNFYPDSESRYEGLVPEHCKQLLGPKYALLRPEFRELRESFEVKNNAVKDVLVFYGGADLTKETGKILKAVRLLGNEHIHFHVILGQANLDGRVLQKEYNDLSNVSFYFQVSNMAEMMTVADLFFGAGGTTTWERCCMGLPSIVTTVARNQEEMTQYGAEQGILYWLGRAGEVEVEDIKSALQVFTSSPASNFASMCRNAMSLVDGKGVQRIALKMAPPEIELRQATSDDCENVFRWRNDEETRRKIFDTEPIPYDEHCRWFAKAIESDDRILLIAENECRPLGVLRYDLAEREAVVSVYLVPGSKTLGLGSELITQGSSWLKKNCPRIKLIEAEILTINIASRKAFLNAGYTEHHSTFIKNLDE